MTSIIQNEIIGDYYDLIKNVYVFSHMYLYLNDIDRLTIEYNFIRAVLIIISILAVAICFKIVVIFIYFFLIQAITNLISFLCTLCRSKCKVPCCSNVKGAFIYFIKLFKKLYTYNFYAFDSTFVGTFLVVSYFLYLISTITFSALIIQEIESEIKSNFFYVCHFIAFQFNILMEILCVSFYNLRNMKKQFFLSMGYFFLLNLLIIITLMFQRLLVNVYGIFEKSEPRRILNIVFNFFFFIMYTTTIIKLILYNVNKEAFKILLSEKEDFYGDSLPFDTNYESNKIDAISRRYKIKGFYCSRDKHNMFKRKDRFDMKIYLIIIFSLLAAVNAFEMGYNIFRLSTEIIEDIDEFTGLRYIRKTASIVHMVMIIILTWMTFVKMKIRTVIFY